MVKQKFGLIWLVFLIAPLNMGEARDLAQSRRFQYAEDNIDHLAAFKARRRLSRKRSENLNGASSGSIQGCLLGCANGGQCVNGVCICAEGYTGTDCSQRDCIPKCENGGTCRSGVCDCAAGYSGSACQTPVCAPACQNGGQCVAPNKCSCPSGWIGKSCNEASCESPCLNGGMCIRPNECLCRLPHKDDPSVLLFYDGSRCEKPLCHKGCVGGVCWFNSTDVCKCFPGYSGDDCSIENKCKKSVDPGVSLHYLQNTLSLRTLSADDLATQYAWNVNERQKKACFDYLEGIRESCDSPDGTHHFYEECKQVCIPSSTANVCERIWEPSKLGFKEHNETRWYHKDGVCKPFAFKGCAGNDNNFEKEQDCKLSCSEQSYNDNHHYQANPLFPQMPGMCYAYGRGHYRTFDGKNYYFYGTCKYQMVYVKDPLIKFSVVLINDPNCDINADCKKGVEVVMEDANVFLGTTTAESGMPYVTINGIQESIPYKKRTPSIRVAGRYVILKSAEGALVYWDGRQDLMIKLPDTFKTGEDGEHQVLGLCGTYDDNPKNDFANPQGMVSESLNTFVQTWKDDSDGLCDIATEIKPPPPCYSSTGSVNDGMALAQSICTTMLEADDFKGCRDRFPVTQYKVMCMSDVCACNRTDRMECACKAASLYARACHVQMAKLPHHEQDWRIRSWRKTERCEQKCPGKMEWTECGSACPRTCTNLNSDKITCLSGCVDGCHCPPNLWKDGNQCVPKEECSCNHAGIYYKHRSIRSSACEQCICEGGSWDCVKLKCDGTCWLYGNSHIKTFDQKTYDMKGKCGYVLSKHCHAPNGSNYEIRLINKKTSECSSPGSKCEQDIEVDIVGELPIVLGKQKLLTFGGKEVKTYQMTQNGLVISFLGMSNVVVKSKRAKISILWTGENLYLGVDSSLFGQTCGLCGTFDGDTSNDFHTHDDDNEVSAQSFALQWATPDSVTSKCVEEKWNEQKLCEFYYQKKDKAAESCKILQDDEKFTACHKVVSPTIFHDSCVSDTCAAHDGYLGNIHAYIKACADKGVIIKWWKPTSEKRELEEDQCPANSNREYKTCNTDENGDAVCENTCLEFSDPQYECTSQCAPGCYCKEGFYSTGQDQCVRKSECPCMHDGVQYQKGHIRSEYCNNCTCNEGAWQCTGLDCDAHYAQWGRVFTECGYTCDNLATCQAGYYCPEGQALHENGTCVSQDTGCQCKHGDTFYDLGATNPSDCSKTCQQRRTWATNSNVNPEPNYECAAWGQDHYKTFDGKIFNFDGERCEYILMQHEDVVVTVANKRCEHTFDMYMCKEVKILLTKENLRITLFQKTYKLENTNTNEVVHSDYDNPCHDIYGGVMMEYKGLFVILKLYYLDFEIKYDKGSRVYIKATSDRHMTEQGNLRGLCGDFDGRNFQDDFVLPDNSVAVEVTEFANKWAADAGCVDAAVKDTCAENPSLGEWAQKGCEEIKTNPAFGTCHATVDPDPYVEACEQETCKCKYGGDCNCFCSAVAAYVRECNRLGISFAWRREGFCELSCCRACRNESHYTPDIPVTPVCEDTPHCTGPERCCRGDHVEGCSCPPHQYFDGKSCKPIEQNCTKQCTPGVPSSYTVLPTTQVSSTISVPITSSLQTTTQPSSTQRSSPISSTTSSSVAPSTSIYTSPSVSTAPSSSVSVPTTIVSSIESSVSSSQVKSPSTSVVTPTTSVKPSSSYSSAMSSSAPTTMVHTPSTASSSKPQSSSAAPSTSIYTSPSVSTAPSSSVSVPTTIVSSIQSSIESSAVSSSPSVPPQSGSTGVVTLGTTIPTSSIPQSSLASSSTEFSRPIPSIPSSQASSLVQTPSTASSSVEHSSSVAPSTSIYTSPSVSTAPSSSVSVPTTIVSSIESSVSSSQVKSPSTSVVTSSSSKTRPPNSWSPKTSSPSTSLVHTASTVSSSKPESSSAAPSTSIYTSPSVSTAPSSSVSVPTTIVSSVESSASSSSELKSSSSRSRLTTSIYTPATTFTTTSSLEIFSPSTSIYSPAPPSSSAASSIATSLLSSPSPSFSTPHSPSPSFTTSKSSGASSTGSSIFVPSSVVTSPIVSTQRPSSSVISSSPFASTIASSISPSSPRPSSSPSASVSICPSCFYKGKYYAPNSTWSDGPCTTLHCKKVPNACLPLNESVQIEQTIEKCEPCAQGYSRPESSDVCCPACVPNPGTLPPNVNLCEATELEELFIHDNNCTSSVKVVTRRCSGMCQSSYDTATDTSQCTCCRPKQYTTVDVNLECPDPRDNFLKEVKVVESCECQVIS